MKCSECNSEMSIDMKKVGTDKNNMPIFSKYAYCEHCKIMKKIEQEELQKKTNSILSVLSIVFTGVPMIMYMPIIVSVPMTFIGFIIALVDLGIGDKSKKTYRFIFWNNFCDFNFLGSEKDVNLKVVTLCDDLLFF